MKFLRILLPLFCLLMLMPGKTEAQFLMDRMDTARKEGFESLGLHRKYDHLRLGGYIQPQFQVASKEGISSYEGGDFAANVSNRFMLRRSRIRIDYIHAGALTGPDLQIAFQIDANEKGFTVRDVWGRLFENKFKLFSLTTGMFARPFGFEINYSSSDRESPERGRMSQILMKSERDLGVMLSLDPRNGKSFPGKFKADIGLFNGQGIVANGDFDNIKDLIARISLKPVKISDKVQFSAGASTLQGGLVQNTRYRYYTGTVDGIKTTKVDSIPANLHAKAPRIYYGADAQVKIRNRIGFSEFRAELIRGQQTGSISSSETPVELMHGRDGFYVRNFNGAYFYYVQCLFSLNHQLVVKYDWYDPNREVSGSEIGREGSAFTSAEIRYNTLGAGYVWYMTENVKLVLYYARVLNESTKLAGYTSDLPDNVMTMRMQFRF